MYGISNEELYDIFQSSMAAEIESPKKLKHSKSSP